MGWITWMPEMVRHDFVLHGYQACTLVWPGGSRAAFFPASAIGSDQGRARSRLISSLYGACEQIHAGVIS